MADKRAKEAVHYTAQAMNPHEQCHVCENFVPPDDCKKVRPKPISPHGWCELFKKKQTP